MQYTVGEMAKLLQLSSSTLRYYDKEGLLPFVERSKSGIRIFKEIDYEWLQVINCLKITGMPLKDIKEFIYMAMEGDNTIDERLQLFINQREIVKKQIETLQGTLDILHFKCWYYETAKACGTTAIPRNMKLEEIPKELREARKKLHNLPNIND